jgi:hypothetical protein
MRLQGWSARSAAIVATRNLMVVRLSKALEGLQHVLPWIST